MSLQDNLFVEEVENDVTLFTADTKRKRVLIFPPTNNYRRYLIHQFVQENFSGLLNTFSIGEGLARRTVVCYNSDVIRNSKLNAVPSSEQIKVTSSISNMGVEMPRSSSASPENSRQRQVKSVPAVEIYRPPPARRLRSVAVVAEMSGSTLPTKVKQRRPDRAVYVPKARRSIDTEGTSLQSHDESSSMKSSHEGRSKVSSSNSQRPVDTCDISTSKVRNDVDALEEDLNEIRHDKMSSSRNDASILMKNLEKVPGELDEVCVEVVDNQSKDREEISEVMALDNSDSSNNGHLACQGSSDQVAELEIHNSVTKFQNTSDAEKKEITDNKPQSTPRNFVSDVLIISGSDSNKSQKNIVDSVEAVPLRPLEKKTKKVARTKSKPALPPTSPVKINRDECDWDSLFDDNGECLDPTLIEELTAAVGEVTIEQPKNVCKTINRPIEVSSDEFAHVVEIYNFPSDFKTSDLAAVFSPFKNGGFELKWVDDTHCLGVFSSPLVAAEVLASDHQFVKTRPLSEATALSRTKVRRSAEFLQPYRSRPETCAALARRLVTGALGVKLATAQQEREREKVLLREAKERRRLANKQREDAWEGIIAQK